MEKQHLNALNEIYDSFVRAMESEFGVDEYSSNYRKLDGELTLVINNNELYVSFAEVVTVILNFWTKEQKVIPIGFDSGEWFVQPYSDWNKSDNPEMFNEKYLNRIIRHFKSISRN